MPQKEGRAIAIERVKEIIRNDPEPNEPAALAERCRARGIPAPENGVSTLRVFGRNLRLDWKTLEIADEAGAAASQTDQILVLHYLACPGNAVPGGDLISFRDLTGGIFYWEPFRSRTVAPLIAKFADDFEALERSLGRFDWQRAQVGDFGARIHGLGNLYLTLVCYRAEEGLPAEFQALFDPAMKKVFQAEDAAAFAGRICLGLLS